MKTQFIYIIATFITLCVIRQNVFANKKTSDKEKEAQISLNSDDSIKLNKLLLEASNFERKLMFDKAIDAANEALKIAEAGKYKYGQYKAYRALESIYRQSDKPILAKKYQLKAVNMKAKLDEDLAVLSEKEKQEKDKLLYLQQQQLEEEQRELNERLSEIERLNKDKNISKEELALKKQEILNKQIELQSKMNTIEEQKNILNMTSEELTLTKQELENQKLVAKIFDDSLQMTKKTEELNKKELERQSLFNYLLILGLSFFIILAAAIYRLYFLKKSNQEILEKKNIEIEKEKKRSDDLLLNILPENVANELKNNGKSEPKFFENVTIMFTDFKDFTKVSEAISAKVLVEQIDFIFRKFDDIVDKFGLEKIKTIGDAYLCVSGIPDANTHRPVNVIKAAQEIEEFIFQLGIEKKKTNQQFFEIRIGVHTGPLVAGIVGAKKFAYDIWGDTVNTAARMEQNSVPGKINISGATYELIKDEIPCDYRGKIAAKNKGEVDMYFVSK
jgi:adenylate cyclase